MTSRVSFVIPVRNDAARLRRCLARIAANTNAEHAVEILVIDNGSTDDSARVAVEGGARVLHVPTGRVSALRNRGVAETAGDIVAFVDSDNEIADGWLAAAVGLLTAPGVGGAGALCTSPGETWVQSMYGALRGATHGSGQVRWLGAGNLVVRREVFAAVGGFDESLEACEDVDLCQRLVAAGWRLVGDERLGSVHRGDPATLLGLFRAERWRGRDNLRVTLRSSMSVRDFISVAVPCVQACGILAILLGALCGWVSEVPVVPWILVAAAAIAAPSLLRAFRMVTTGRLKRPREAWQAFVVAVTYDLARATALFSRASHHRRTASSAAATT